MEAGALRDQYSMEVDVYTRSIVGFALLCLMLTVSPSCAMLMGDGTIKLFNGKNLVGWDYFLVDESVKMEDVWSVQDGLLVCKGEPLGHIHTKAKFKTNFKLFVEWRWAPGTEPGNSGVLLRINGEPRGIPRSHEAQLRRGSAGDLYGFHGMKIDGCSDRRRSANNETIGELTGFVQMTKNENNPGEWNLYEITSWGDRLSVKVNGERVNEAWGCELVEGPIGLQSEGGEIHFRSVELVPIVGEF